MTRTVAPNERGGRLLRNWALTTPELPDVSLDVLLVASWAESHTVRPGDLAPDDTDLGATDLLGCAVDESDLLSEVEAVKSLVRSRRMHPIHEWCSPGSLGILNALNLDQTGTRVGGVLATLVAQVTAPMISQSISILSFQRSITMPISVLSFLCHLFRCWFTLRFFWILMPTFRKLQDDTHLT